MNANPPPPPPPPATPTPPPADAAPAPAKKGLSPLAWVAIGCGGILLVAAVVVALGVGWLFEKGKDVARDIEADPAMAAAEMLVRLNPELELVASDREAGTVTVREKDTGKELTVDLAELKEGRIRFESDQGEGSVEIGGEAGVFRMESPEGGSVVVGSGEVPVWIPAYPGSTAEPTVLFSNTDASGRRGALSFETDDEPSAVLDFYVGELESAGYEVERTGVSGSFGRGGQLDARHQAEGRTIGLEVMAAGDDGATRAMLNYQERAGDAG